MERITIGKAAKEAAYFTVGLIVFTLFMIGAIWLAAPIQDAVGAYGVLAELVLFIFVVLLAGRLIYDRI